MQNNKNNISNNTRAHIYIAKKKKVLWNKMQKKVQNSILGLSKYSYEQEGCANGYVHIAAIRMRINILRLTMSLVSVYETGFALRSLMA